MNDRNGYIGASDCAAVLGLSRWKTPLQIWAEKTGKIEPQDISNNLNVKLGLRLEEVVAELFEEKTGKKVHKISEPFTHKKFDFLKCHIDRKVENENAILQCKTASVWKAKEWEEEGDIPFEYILQEIHELACSGYKRAYIAVLIGNSDFKWKIIERDENLIDSTIKKEVDFWNNFVIPKIMPSTIMAEDKDTIFKLFPKPKIENLKNISDLDLKIESIKNLQKNADELLQEIEKQKNIIKADIAEYNGAEGLIWNAFLKNQKTKRIDLDKLKKEEPKIFEKYLKETENRVLRFSKKESKLREGN